MSDSDTDTTTPARHPARTMVGFSVGATVIVLVVLSAFVLPLINSGPHQVPLGVVGPEQAIGAVDAALDDQQWQVQPFTSGEELAAAVTDREVAGGLVLGADGVDVYTATAAGPSAAGAIAALGNGVAAQQGGTATVTDLAPFPADDPRGGGFAAAALPLLIAGLLPAVGLLRLFPGHEGLRTRLVGAALFSLVAGLSVAAYLQYFTGTLSGPYWANAATLSLGMVALSFTFLGLESLLGWPGLGLGVAIVMLLGDPLSAIASGPNWLPDGWSTLGQLLPPGATGTLLRSTAYFDGADATKPALTLAAWVLLGLVLALVAGRRRPHNRTAA